MISKATVTNEPNDKNTIDRVFALSVTEANEFFTTAGTRKCQGTEYCNDQYNYNGKVSWWLRSPAGLTYNASFVDGDGVVNDSAGTAVYGNLTAVRPAMWIKIVN